MERSAAIQQIREACKIIVQQFMKIHPAVPHLQHPATQDEFYKTLHQMTVELETLKKQLGKLEREDASTVL
jgi:GTP1/Obg family GTP-binding protein